MFRRILRAALVVISAWLLVVPAVAGAQSVDEPLPVDELAAEPDPGQVEEPPAEVAAEPDPGQVDEPSAEVAGELAAVSTSCSVEITALDETQCQALVAIGRASDGARLFPGRGWDQSDDPSDPCTWLGVTCRNDNVVKLIVPKAKLQGELSPQIGDLVHLKVLELANIDRDNGITDVPPSIGALTELHTLRLNRHRLSTLPAEIGEMSALTRLDLRHNDITTLPAQVGSLHSLVELDLSQNDLTELPAEVATLTALEELRLAINPLVSLPSLSGALALEDLDISNTLLRRLPDGLSPVMRELDADDAKLARLPENLGATTTLEVLDLGGNGIESVPASIGNLPALRRLDLGENELRELPAELGALASLTIFDLSGNRLRGNQDHWATSLVTNSSIQKAWFRVVRDIGGNDCLSSQDPEVQRVFLALDPGWDRCDNPLEPDVACPVNQTSIPEIECGTVYSLILQLWGAWDPGVADPCTWRSVTCADGHVVGFRLVSRDPADPQIPAIINNLQQLETLTLRDLNLTEVPASLAQNRELRRLELDSNQLTTLPPELATLPHLEVVNLSFNPLEELPLAVVTSSTIKELYAYRTGLRTVPAEISSMVNLRELHLSSNELQSLPEEMGQLVRLKDLRLQQNQLTALPPLTALTRLRELWVGDNALTEIPPLGDVRLTALDLSDNQLTVQGISNIVGQDQLKTFYLRGNLLRGDFTETATVLVEADRVSIDDGLVGNDCLTVDDSDVAARLTALNPGWDRCDVPDGTDPFASCASDITELERSQCEALITIGRTSDGKPIFYGNGWPIDQDPSDPCSWTGVVCADGNVERFSAQRHEGFPDVLQLDLTPIGQLDHLTYLSIRVGNLRELPATIGNLSRLTHLELNRHDFTTVPDEIGNLTALTFVDLGQNKIVTVPPALFQLPLVEELSLWANPLTGGLPSMGSADSLHKLRVGASRLRRLPDELAPTLEVLWATGADLIELPETLDSAPLLRELNLGDNKLSSLPDALGRLPLEELTLTSNRFVGTLPDVVGELSELRSLSVSRNQLSSLPDTFGRLPLERLDLSNNRFVGTLPDVVGELSSLHWLSASRNQLGGDQDNWATALVNSGLLESLNLWTAPRYGQRGDETNDCLTATASVVRAVFAVLNPAWDTCSDPVLTPEPPADAEAVCPQRYREATKIPVVECAAVVAIFESVYGADWQHPYTNLCTGSRGARSITCSGRRVVGIRLNKAPVGAVIPSDIKKLVALEFIQADNGSITSLPAEIGDMVGLRSIRASNAELTTLPQDLSRLINLSELNLRLNPLTTVPVGVYTIPNLDDLDLSRTKIVALDPAIIGQLAAIEVDLSDNKLTSIPESIADAEIVRLDLANNDLTSIPAGLSVAVLHELNLENNKITSLPDSVGAALWQELDVSGNRLTELPATMTAMTALRHLDLEHNRLTTVTPVGAISTLVELDVSDNQLTELPELRTPRLEVLDADHNQLTSLPAGVADTRLHWLDAGHNFIAELPADIGNLGRFSGPNSWSETLDLRNNQLTSLPDSFGEIEVDSINLRSNRLSLLPDTFGNLVVRELKLQSNALASLPESFGDIEDLEALNLSENRLTELPASFGDLLAKRANDHSVHYEDVINVADNRLRGDITPWLERAALGGYTGALSEGRFRLDDGQGGNDCLFVTIAVLETILDRQSSLWDACDAP